MARKKRPVPQPDEDGWVRTGIYKRNARPEPILSVDDAEAHLKQYVDGLNSPLAQDLGKLRDWLADIIRPHVDGPFGGDRERGSGQVYYALDFGDGVKWYRAKPSLEETPRATDAIDAMNQLRIAEIHLAPDGKRDWLFRTAWQLGQLCERIEIRPFEPLVLKGKVFEKTQRERVPRTVWNDEVENAARRLMEAIFRGSLSYDAAVRRTCARLKNELGIEVGRSTVKRYLPASSFPSPGDG